MRREAGASFEELFERWLIGRRFVAESTARDYLRHIRWLSDYVGVSPEDLRAEHLEDVLGEPTFSWSTKNTRLVVARLWHRWGADRGLWSRDPDLIDLRLPRRRPPAKDGLTLAQCRTLLTCAAPLERRLIYLGLYAGLRVSEMVSINRSCWVEGVAGDELRILNSKFGKSRRIPVHPHLGALREEILDTPCKSKKWLQRAAIGMRDEIDRDDFTPQLLRATFAQVLRDVGVWRSVVGALLGHSDSSVTTASYAPVTWREECDAIAMLPY